MVLPLAAKGESSASPLCPRCGFRVGPDQGLCLNCGSSLSNPPPAPTGDAAAYEAVSRALRHRSTTTTEWFPYDHEDAFAVGTLTGVRVVGDGIPFRAEIGLAFALGRARIVADLTFTDWVIMRPEHGTHVPCEVREHVLARDRVCRDYGREMGRLGGRLIVHHVKYRNSSSLPVQ